MAARPGVAEVGDFDEIERSDAGRLVVAADHRRLLAHRPRPVARAGAIRDASVERHADDSDVDPGRRFPQRPAKEGRDAGVTRPKLGVRSFRALGDRSGHRGLIELA